MSDHVLIGLAAAHLVATLLALKQLWREKFNIVPLTVLLSCVFYLLPAWAWFLGKEDVFRYALRFMFVYELSGRLTTAEKAYPFLAILALAIGGLLGGLRRAPVMSPPQLADRVLVDRGRVTLLAIFISLLMIALIVYAIRSIGFSALYANRTDYPLEACKVFLYLGPIAIATLFAIKDRRFSLPVIFWASMSLWMAFACMRRRDVHFVLIYCFVLYHVSGMTLKQRRMHAQRRLVSFAKYALFGLMLLYLIAFLWYSKHIRKQLVQEGPRIVQYWTPARGVTEVVFGSGAMGFMTYCMVNEYVHSQGVAWGHCVYSVLGMPIPRAIWSSKPVLPASLLIHELYLEMSPSVFWLNDLYLSFGQFGILIAFGIGFVGTRRYRSLLAKSGRWSKIELALATAMVIVFFKNGIAMFIALFGFAYALLGICYVLVVRVDTASGPGTVPVARPTLPVAHSVTRRGRSEGLPTVH